MFYRFMRCCYCFDFVTINSISAYLSLLILIFFIFKPLKLNDFYLNMHLIFIYDFYNYLNL
jgi:hypothetical protein